MILLIIRHGESEADILDVHEGRADFELTKKGHEQASAMANYVTGNYRLTRIYASTLKRAAQTAKHLSDESGIAIEYEPDLMEFNNGMLAGLSREDADRLYPYIENLPIDQAVYGQESKVDFRSRAEKVLQRVLSENGPESVIAIVTHGGMVNQLYGAMLHMPIGENIFFRTSDTGIHVWDITKNSSYVIKANIDDHIRGI
ncbi:histidine phosphatase family protein [Butyrivibrio sp.]|uniref:histidine phosphatase family protein n=1 Tax=Butyrivibrio sp. TaxID=28121 RepID=UPI001D474B54|nr:histidine phosphatase family protein [Butyrivibrio sp.]MBE5839751.1 histidine phosphatase family protein [Butyrivibrio sp.]MBE6035987.1 histidine phosphatase family protein [Clostridiales bacterium]